MRQPVPAWVLRDRKLAGAPCPVCDRKISNSGWGQEPGFCKVEARRSLLEPEEVEVNTEPVFVGIDVSKAHLDVAFSHEQEVQRLANDEAGIESLVGPLQPRQPTLVVMEATGGFEVPAAAALAAAGVPVVIANPRQTRDFAKSTGQLSKTDAIDARGLALFAARVRPEVRELPSEEARILDALIGRRRQLVAMITQEKNRLGYAVRPVQKGIRKHLRWLERQLADVDRELDSRIRASPVWAAKRDLLQSVPGVGPNLARTLIAELPELGRLSHKEIASLVGVAPRARDSGVLRGKRMLWGGRATVRTALYMSVWSATRWNPVIRVFYERLREKGKPAKVAQAACMRKLLILLNAMVRDHRPWDPSLPLGQAELQHSC
jgi:transposase